MKTIYLLLLVGLLALCSACSNSSLKSAEEELKDGVASVMDSDNKYVLMVKNGYRENTPGLTYDKAFSNFFTTPRWKYFKGDNEQEVVEFTGDCTYQDATVKAKIQFVVDEKQKTFNATYLSFNEVPQNMFILSALIEKAFTFDPKQTSVNNQIPTKNNDVSVAQTNTQKPTSEEIIYKGKTITNWLGKRPKGLWDEFGTPSSTGKARGGDYRSYDGITFFINVQRDEIMYVGGTNLELFTINGDTLDKDRAGLISIFGNPRKEGQIIGGDNEGAYYMAYDYMGYSLVFYRSNPNGKIEWFEVSNKKE